MRTYDAGPLLEAEHAVARVLGDAERLPDVAKELLAAIGTPLGWELGAGWEPDGGGGRMIELWTDGALGDGALAAIRATDRLARGVGLPGRVLASGEPAWIVDVTEDPNFPRRGAAPAGRPGAAFCFPVVSERLGFAGAIEFLPRQRLEPDERLLETMESLGRRM